MPNKLHGIFVDMSRVADSNRLSFHDALNERIHRNETFKGTVDEHRPDLLGFDFANRATDAERRDAVAQIKAFLHLSGFPAEVRAF